MPPVTQRSERADAQRNRQKVLDTAERLIGERGTGVTLGEIAAAAGVGAGTVYRHFPTKDALVATVLDRRVEQVVKRAHAAAGDGREPGEMFFDFLRYVADQALRNRALCEALASRGEWMEPTRETGACVIDEPVAYLLERAQRAGEVREGVGPRDVLALIPAYVALEMSLGSAERARHLAEMLWDGLRPPAKRNSQYRDETSEATSLRNETRSGGDNETDHRCPVCGEPIEVAGTGRPPKYCSSACRQKAFRDKRRAAA